MKALCLLLCILLAGVFIACERETTYVEEIAGPVTCAQCHDPSNIITGKQTQWAESGHGTGESYLRGTSAGCAGCHSGNAFAEQVVGAGLAPNQLTKGDPDPTRQDCRACHRIHESYTIDDFALQTTSPVSMYAVPGATYDGGEGNLCVNCHQPRRIFPEAVNDTIFGISEHWGPHHGPQSAMLLGLAGAGVEGDAHGHYGGVVNTCVACHMGADAGHNFEPELATCQKCHTDAKDFDYHKVQTQVIALTDQLGEELLALGLINENSPDGHPTVEEAQLDQAVALWNWIYVAHEDKSNGVHNPGYAIALLEEGLERLGASRTSAPAMTQARVGARTGGSD